MFLSVGDIVVAAMFSVYVCVCREPVLCIEQMKYDSHDHFRHSHLSECLMPTHLLVLKLFTLIQQPRATSSFARESTMVIEP